MYLVPGANNVIMSSSVAAGQFPDAHRIYFYLEEFENDDLFYVVYAINGRATYTGFRDRLKRDEHLVKLLAAVKALGGVTSFK